MGIPEDWSQLQSLANAHVEFKSDQVVDDDDCYAASIPLADAM